MRWRNANWSIRRAEYPIEQDRHEMDAVIQRVDGFAGPEERA